MKIAHVELHSSRSLRQRLAKGLQKSVKLRGTPGVGGLKFLLSPLEMSNKEIASLAHLYLSAPPKELSAAARETAPKLFTAASKAATTRYATLLAATYLSLVAENGCRRKSLHFFGILGRE